MKFSIKKVGVFLSIGILIVGYYGYNISQNINVKVAMMPSNSFPILFSIMPDRTIEVAMLNVPIFDIRDNFSNSVTESKKVSVSETDAKEIKNLVKKVKKSVHYSGDHPLLSIDGDEVQACIGDKLFCSMYQDDYCENTPESVNTALLDLVYKLVEVTQEY